MNGSGDRLAIANPRADVNGPDSGLVQIYQLINGSWMQIGNDIVGNVANDNLGNSIAFNQQGNILAVGIPEENFSEGFAKVFEFVSDNWQQIDNDISGTTAAAGYGNNVALNSSGNTFVSATISNNGRVEVFKNENILSTNNFESNSFQIYPNPATSQVTITGLEDLDTTGITIVDVSGRTVLEHTKFLETATTFSTENLKTGLYFVNIQLEKGTLVKQLIIE